MAKSKERVKIENRIVALEQQANELYHERKEILEALKHLNDMLKDE